MSVDISGFT